MPAIGVQHCLENFKQDTQESLALIDFSRSLKVLDYRTGNYKNLNTRYIELFAGIALLKVNMAWESFIEDVFIRYMCGATTKTGFTPTLISLPKSTIAQAMSVLLSPSLQYLTWTTKNTLNRANLYFSRGEPFTTSINSIYRTLDDIAAIRNCFAHRSEYSRSEFRSVVLRSFGYIPKGISPGRLLLTKHPSVPSLSFLEVYINILIGASLIIAP